VRDIAFLPDGREGEAGNCRSCGAPVVWVVNPKTGKRPPYNEDGTSHFATCPQAAAWKGTSTR
jgi:hypothetical protein